MGDKYFFYGTAKLLGIITFLLSCFYIKPLLLDYIAYQNFDHKQSNKFKAVPNRNKNVKVPILQANFRQNVMPTPEALLSGLLAFAWIWRIGSSVYASYSLSEAITPTYFGNGVKVTLAGLQILTAIFLDFLPLTQFPRVSLVHRIITIPSQAYSLYYANKYIGPVLDSRRVTIIIYIVSLLCILETVYKINLDWNRIE